MFMTVMAEVAFPGLNYAREWIFGTYITSDPVISEVGMDYMKYASTFTPSTKCVP